MINFALLDNLKIKNKLVALFSAVLLGFFILGVTYWLENQATQTAGSRSTAFIEYESLSSQAQKNYLKMRKYESDFALNISGDSGQTYNDAPLENHNKHALELEGIMNELSAVAPQIDSFTQDVILDNPEADTDDYVRSLVTQASEVTADYKTSFADIVKFQKLIGFTENDGLRKIANDKFFQLDKRVARTADSTLSAYLQLMRENQGKIIRSTDLTAAHENLKTASNNFKNYLKISDTTADERISMNSYVDGYISSMNSIVFNKRSATQYTELYDFMLGPIFDEMGQSAQNRIGQNTVALSKQTDRLTSVFVSTVVIVAILLSSILYMFGRSIVRPIQSLQSTIHQVNQGRLDARSQMTREDELGELSDAFDTLLDEKVAQLSGAEKENDQLNESIVELLKSVAHLSRKDFTVRVPVSEDVTGAVADSLNLLAKETGDALNEVRTVSLKVAKVSTQVKDQTKLVMGETRKERKQAESAMSEIRVASTAMQKISSDAQQANEQADNAFNNTQVALDTVNESVQGINSIRDTISETEKRIKRLGERSQEITGIVNLINSISERTHILALNASMHAASAGEAGRGFAVVADEVQRLAENAREATKEIGTLVNNIQVETGDTVVAMNDVITQVAKGTELASKAENAMLMTQASTKELVDAVDLIANSSKSQAKATNGLLDQANEIVESTRQTDRHMKQQSVNTELLGRYSKNLVQTVSEFKLVTEHGKTPEIETTAVDELEKELDIDLMVSNQ
ncbi:MAG: methyl-accepting chemotaxis protein [Gammaproteobacteria bacterium]|nr:methyl-accepting chemotaxis protein [Gammaproteobacteria bacterium]